jgi:YHS domain-containing protein
MKVDREKAVTKEIGGETFYFCATHCLHAFEVDPAKYTRGKAADRRRAAHAHH